MNRLEAEKLLGGYATGTLTDSEKQVLFAAALEHQELFDALMDEEVLRELLAEPEARRQLLAVLPQPEMAQRKVQTFWRRPAVMGLAASLFVLVTTSYVVLRRTEPAALDLNMAQQRQEDTHQLGAMVAAEATSQDKAEAAMPNPASEKDASPRKAKASTLAAIPGSAPPVAGEPSGAGKGREEEAKVDASLAEQAGVVAEGAVTSSRLARAAKPQERPSTMGDSLSAPKLPAPSAAPGLIASGAAKSEVSQRWKSAEVSGLQVAPLEALPDGRVRLTVSWGRRGYLYVLKRSVSEIAVLRPLILTTAKTGTQRATFELTFGAQDLVDVYVLPAPTSDPAALPASAEVQGDWRRIYPE